MDNHHVCCNIGQFYANIHIVLLNLIKTQIWASVESIFAVDVHIISE